MNKSKIDVTKINSFMIQHGLDAVLSTNRITGAYLTNLMRFPYYTFQRENFPLFPVFLRTGGSFVVGNVGDFLPTSMRPAWIDEFYSPPSSMHEECLALLTQTLRAKGLEAARIGIDIDSVPAKVLSSLQAALPNAEFVAADLLFFQLRAKKTDKEVEILKAALAALEAGYVAILKAVKPGRSMREIMQEYAQTVHNHGGQHMGSNWTSIFRDWYTEDSLPERHVRFSRDWILEPDPELALNVDTIGCRYSYWSDNAIAFCLGDPPRRIVGEYEQRWRAVRRVSEVIRRGMSAKGAYEAAKDVIDREVGYSGKWDCHGIGLDVLEEPLMGIGSNRNELEDLILEPNTVICIEAGAGVEQTYVMGETGLHRLSTLPQQLHVIK